MVFTFLGILGLLWKIGGLRVTMPYFAEEFLMVDEDFVILVVVVLIAEGVVVLFFVAEVFAVFTEVSLKVEVGELRVTMPEFEEEFAVVVDVTIAEFTEVSSKVDVGESCKL